MCSSRLTLPRPLHVLGLVGLMASAVCAATPAARATARPWHMLETPRFVVLSQLDDDATEAWAAEFNQFVTELGTVFKVTRPHLPPLTVLLFARDRDLAPYKPKRSDGHGSLAVSGMFVRQDSWSVIGLADARQKQATRELIFHEGVHWFMSVDPRPYPLWLSEGLAEVFSTFQRDGRRVRWGTPIQSHVDLLTRDEPLPLERLLYLSPGDPLFDERDHTGMFYAQSWLFVHYLMFGERAGDRDALAVYLDTLGGRIPADDAFRQVFGSDYAGMNETLLGHLRNGKYYTVFRPESPGIQITEPIVAAPPHLIEASLARLAIGAGHLDRARPHAEQARTLAPDDPAGYEVLALVAHHRGDLAQARWACTEAARLGSRDAQTLFLLAYLRTQPAPDRDLELPAADARTIADLYHRVIDDCPWFKQAYQNLAALAGRLPAPEPRDFDALRQGVKLFPNAGDLRLGVAELAAARGDRRDAHKILEGARARGLSVADEARARALEQKWIYDDYTERIQRAVSSQRFEEALALYDELLPQIADVPMRINIGFNRQNLANNLRLAEAETAAARGDHATARAILENLLTQPALQPSTRRAIEERLRRLRP